MLFLYLNPISHHNLSCYFITSIGICFQKLEMQSTDVILFQWPICKPGRSEHPKHGEVLDEVLRDEIKDLPPEQIRQVLEYIGQLKEQ